MNITDEKANELLEAAKPLIKWLSENTNPHCTAIVDMASVELTEGIAARHTDEFLDLPGSNRTHDSNCAVHNAPAYPAKACDCSLSKC